MLLIGQQEERAACKSPCSNKSQSSLLRDPTQPRPSPEILPS